MKLKLKYTSADIGLNGCEGHDVTVVTDGPNLRVTVHIGEARHSAVVVHPETLFRLEGARLTNTLTIDGFVRDLKGDWREARIQLT